MATGAHLNLALLFVFISVSASVSAASRCSSTTFSADRTFAHCRDLPHLDASLHWTYDSTARNLSIAFVATPASPEGWVAWAINPSGGGMRGSQALIGFHQANGSMGVKTYNITEYGPIAEGRIDFQPADLAAEFSGGAMRIFGKLVLPQKMSPTVKQVWQVGATVANGVPQRHEFDRENLEAVGLVDLSRGVFAQSPPPDPAASTPASSGTSPPGAAGGGSPHTPASGCKNLNGISKPATLIILLAFGFLFI
ncbi:auxin-induced in root cultures protein 12-like [Zingiber officinale]|uniref:DOMON domain-containing protein n=1 Tax=Zingiber officinale TaxID=94328 RepID=A0A8J5LD04_ZINOF|nr:auxin-induced in root cultures protein 12-like [Zingiber officinale]KAG6508612.1 hypothetical protein ZIOFF_033991 [Zingiber officinale]